MRGENQGLSLKAIAMPHQGRGPAPFKARPRYNGDLLKFDLPIKSILRPRVKKLLARS